MFSISDFLLPLTADQAVSPGWTPATGNRPVGVTWHWTATATLAEARAMLGGANATRKGEASAHFGVGRSYREGTDRYVLLENRSWHAGALQSLRWDGQTLGNPDFRGLRTCVGIETVNLGYARDGLPAGPDWIEATTPDHDVYRIQPWTAEQIQMCIAIGKVVVARWPGIGPRNHHGHHDLCPQYKEDVTGFPFATVLRGIYADPSIPDVWSSLWTVRQRQTALIRLGYNLGSGGADGLWGSRSLAALKSFQASAGLVVNGFWTSFVCWKVYDVAKARGLGWPLG